jgi:ABC-2 type transport system permease protein
MSLSSGTTQPGDALQAALTTTTRPAGSGAAAHVLTFAWRALLKIKHAPEQWFDVIVTPIMFTIMFTYLFGGALAGSTGDYLQFLLPGILVQTVMFTSIYTGFTLNTDLSRGVFDRFRSLPIWYPAPLVGAMLGDTVRYTVSSLIVFAIGLVLGYRPETGVIGVAVTILLLDVFAFGIGWIFTTLALVVKSPSSVMTMSWLVLMPLNFMSNIYVDPVTMPAWLQAVVEVNPVALLATAVRGIMDGTVTGGELGWAMLTPAVVVLICAPLAMRLYRRDR